MGFKYALDVPVYRGRDEFDVVESKISNYFIFEENEALDVWYQKWSLKRYLKMLMRLRFGLSNGHFERWVFNGRYIDAEPARYRSPSPAGDRDLQNTEVTAYVATPAKTNKYDLVLGQINDVGTIVERFCVRRTRKAPIKIFRETKTRTGAHLITGLLLEDL